MVAVFCLFSKRFEPCRPQAMTDSKVAIQVAYSLKNDVTYRREVDNLLSFASSSKEKHSLFIVTYEEEKTIVEGGYKIEVVPLKKFLLGQY